MTLDIRKNNSLQPVVNVLQQLLNNIPTSETNPKSPYSVSQSGSQVIIQKSSPLSIGTPLVLNMRNNPILSHLGAILETPTSNGVTAGVIQGLMTGVYNRTHKSFEFIPTTTNDSAGAYIDAIFSNFEMMKDAGENPNIDSIAHSVMSHGVSDLGLPGISSITTKRGMGRASTARTVGTIPFEFRTKEENGWVDDKGRSNAPITNFEKSLIVNEWERRTSVENGPVNPNVNPSIVWNEMRTLQASKSGFLVPMMAASQLKVVNPQGNVQEYLLSLPKNPLKTITSNTNVEGREQVYPWKRAGTNARRIRPEEVTGDIIPDTSGYVRSRVRHTGEEQGREVYLHTFLLSNEIAQQGGGFKYSNPNGFKPAFYAMDSEKSIPIKAGDIRTLGTAANPLEIYPSVFGREIESGRQHFAIGNRGEDNEIMADIGMTSFIPSRVTLKIPKFIDSVTGFASAEGLPNAISSENEQQRLRKYYKSRHVEVERGEFIKGDSLLTVAGSERAPSGFKSGGLKFLPSPTGQRQTVQIPGVTDPIDIDYASAAVKNDAITMYSMFSAFTDKQMGKMLTRQAVKNNSVGGAQFAQWFQDEYIGSGEKDYNFDEITNKYNELTISERKNRPALNPNEFANKLYSDTFENVSPAVNAQNWNEYRMGMVPAGTKVSRGIHSEDAFNFLKESEQRAWTSEHEGKVEGFEDYFNSVYEKKTTSEGLTEVIRTLQKPAFVGRLAVERQTQWAARPSINPDAQLLLSNTDPQLAKALHVYAGTRQPGGKIGRAFDNLRSYLSWESNALENPDSTNSPTNKTVIGMEQARGMLTNLAESADLSIDKRLESLSGFLGKGVNGLLQFGEEGGNYLPNPDAIQAFTYNYLGQEIFGGNAGKYIGAVERMASAVSEGIDVSGRAGWKKQKSFYSTVASSLTSGSDAVKSVLSSKVPGLSGTAVNMPALPVDRIFAPNAPVRRMLYGMGFDESSIDEAQTTLGRLNARFYMFRHPQTHGLGGTGTQLIGEDELSEYVGRERAGNIRSDSEGMDLLYVTQRLQQAENFDNDGDMVMAIAALKRVGRDDEAKLLEIKRTKLKKNMATSQTLSKHENDMYIDQKFRNDVNASVGASVDAQKAKPIITSVTGGRKYYPMRDIVEQNESFRNQHEIGRGTAFNFSRLKESSMGVLGWSNSAIDRGRSSGAAMFQANLDYHVAPDSGIPTSQIFSSARFGKYNRQKHNKELNRDRLIVDAGKTPSGFGGGQFSIDKEDLGSTEWVDKFLIPIARITASKTELKDGSFNLMGPTDLAQMWAASPKVAPVLQEALEKGGIENMPQVLDTYFRGGEVPGVPRIENPRELLQTVGMNMILANAHGKVIGSFDPSTSQYPNEDARRTQLGFDAVLGEQVTQQVGATSLVYDIEKKQKTSSGSYFTRTADRFQSALRAMPQSNNIRKFIAGTARALNIRTPAAENDKKDLHSLIFGSDVEDNVIKATKGVGKLLDIQKRMQGATKEEDAVILSMDKGGEVNEVGLQIDEQSEKQVKVSATPQDMQDKYFWHAHPTGNARFSKKDLMSIAEIAEINEKELGLRHKDAGLAGAYVSNPDRTVMLSRPERGWATRAKTEEVWDKTKDPTSPKGQQEIYRKLGYKIQADPVEEAVRRIAKQEGKNPLNVKAGIELNKAIGTVLGTESTHTTSRQGTRSSLPSINASSLNLNIKTEEGRIMNFFHTVQDAAGGNPIFDTPESGKGKKVHDIAEEVIRNARPDSEIEQRHVHTIPGVAAVIMKPDLITMVNGKPMVIDFKPGTPVDRDGKQHLESDNLDNYINQLSVYAHNYKERHGGELPGIGVALYDKTLDAETAGKEVANRVLAGEGIIPLQVKTAEELREHVGGILAEKNRVRSAADKVAYDLRPGGKLSRSPFGGFGQLMDFFKDIFYTRKVDEEQTTTQSIPITQPESQTSRKEKEVVKKANHPHPKQNSSLTRKRAPVVPPTPENPGGEPPNNNTIVGEASLPRNRGMNVWVEATVAQHGEQTQLTNRLTEKVTGLLAQAGYEVTADQPLSTALQKALADPAAKSLLYNNLTPEDMNDVQRIQRGFKVYALAQRDMNNPNNDAKKQYPVGTHGYEVLKNQANSQWMKEGRAIAEALDAKEKPTFKLPEEEIKTYNELLKKQASLQSEVNKLSEKGNESKSKELEQKTKELDLTNRKLVAADLQQSISSGKSVVDHYRNRLASGESLDATELRTLHSAAKGVESDTKALEKYEEENPDVTSGKKGKSLGGFARHIFGGFGLMYMRDIYNIATSGLGYGNEQAMQNQEITNLASGSLFGNRGTVYSQKQQLANYQALYGSTDNPKLYAETVMAKNPGARMAANTVMAGLAAAGATAWLMDSLPEGLAIAGGAGGPAGLAIMAGAATIAGGTAFALDAISGANDKNLPFQDYKARKELLTGTWNPIQNALNTVNLGKSVISYGTQRLTDPEQFEKTKKIEGAMGVLDSLYDKNGSVSANQLKNKTAGLGLENADLLSVWANRIRDKNSAWVTDEGTISAASLIARNPKYSVSDGLASKIAQDYVYGVDTVPTMEKLVAATGRVGSSAYNTAGSLAIKAIDTLPAFTDEKKAQLLSGANLGNSLIGTSFVSGVGSQGGKVDLDKVLNFFSKLGDIANNPVASTALKSSNDSWYINASSGLAPQNFTLPTINPNMTPQQAAIWSSQQVAGSANANRALQLGQSLQSESALGGNAPRVGQNIYNYLNDPNRNPGSDWIRTRLAQHDPMMMAVLSNNGLNLNAGQGLQTLNGNFLNGNLSAFTDTRFGQVTGLSWGTSSIQLGSFSSSQMAGDIWNNWGPKASLVFGENIKKQGVARGTYQNNPNLNQKVIDAYNKGVLDPSGNLVAGTMGARVEQQNEQWAQSELMYGFQVQGRQQELAHTQRSWALQDKSIALGYQQQEYGFGMEQRQMNLSNANQMWQFGFQQTQMNVQNQQQQWQFGFQQQQLNLGNQQWGENFALNKQTAMTQRGFTKADWSYQAQTRELNWGWKQEDFAESERFMTGRERKLADRQMRRDTITYGLEGSNIDRQKTQQAELWKLEDQRFAIEAKQHNENLVMQQTQLDKSIEFYNQNFALQQEQLNHSVAYYKQTYSLQQEQLSKTIYFYQQNKALQQQQLIEDRAYWTDQYNLSRKSQEAAHAWDVTVQQTLNTQTVWEEKVTTTNTALSSLIDGAWTKFTNDIVVLPTALDNVIQRVERLIQLGGGTILGSGGGGGGACFIAGTKVFMADGSEKAIEEIEIGESVFSYDIKTNRLVLANVEKVFHHEEDPSPSYIVINNQIGVTPEHLMFSVGEWKSAGSLKVGDFLLDSMGLSVRINSLEIIEETVPVYNLHTDHETHNYFAEGILVHNVKQQAVGGPTSGTIIAGEEGPEVISLGRQTGFVTPTNALRSMLRQIDAPASQVGFSNFIPGQSGNSMPTNLKVEVYLNGEVFANAVTKVVISGVS